MSRKDLYLSTCQALGPAFSTSFKHRLCNTFILRTISAPLEPYIKSETVDKVQFAGAASGADEKRGDKKLCQKVGQPAADHRG